MKILNVFLIGLVILFISCSTEKPAKQPVTFCNPLNLSYRFKSETNESSPREAADPTMGAFKKSIIFESKLLTKTKIPKNRKLFLLNS